MGIGARTNGIGSVATTLLLRVCHRLPARRRRCMKPAPRPCSPACTSCGASATGRRSAALAAGGAKFPLTKRLHKAPNFCASFRTTSAWPCSSRGSYTARHSKLRCSWASWRCCQQQLSAVLRQASCCSSLVPLHAATVVERQPVVAQRRLYQIDAGRMYGFRPRGHCLALQRWTLRIDAHRYACRLPEWTALPAAP